MRFQVSQVMDAIEQRLTTDITGAQAVVDLGEVVRHVELDQGRPVNLVRVGMVVDALGRYLVDGGAMLYGVVERALLSDAALTSKERMVLSRWADDGLIEVTPVMGDRVVEVAHLTGLPLLALRPYPELVSRYGWLADETGRVLRLTHRGGVATISPMGAPPVEDGSGSEPAVGRAAIPRMRAPNDAGSVDEPAAAAAEQEPGPAEPGELERQEAEAEEPSAEEPEGQKVEAEEPDGQVAGAAEPEGAERQAAVAEAQGQVTVAAEAPGGPGRQEAGAEVPQSKEPTGQEAAAAEALGDSGRQEVEAEEPRPEEPETEAPERQVAEAASEESGRQEAEAEETEKALPFPVEVFAARGAVPVARIRISRHRFRRAEPAPAHAALLRREWRCDAFECPVFGEFRRIGQPVPRLRGGTPVCPRHDQPLVDIGPRPPGYAVAIVVDDLPRQRLVVRAGEPVMVGRAEDDPDVVSVAPWLHEASASWVSPVHLRLEASENGLVVADLSDNGTVLWLRKGPDDPGTTQSLHRESYSLGEWDSLELYTGVELVPGDHRPAVLGRDEPASVLVDAPTAAYHQIRSG